MSRCFEPRQHLLIVVTEDWYYWSHRRPIAEGALRGGYQVTLASRFDRFRDEIEATGVQTVDIELKRTSIRLFDELTGVIDLVRLYRRLRPDVVHHVSIKPVLYGSIAARIAGIRNVVNAIPGLGYVFTAPDWKARIIASGARQAYRVALGGAGTRTIFQNEEDRSYFVDNGMTTRDKTVLIRGSGVDTEEFVPGREGEIPTIVFAGRMLSSKGVRDIVKAFHIVRAKGFTCRLRLLGAPDDSNPEAISTGEIARWSRDADIEWLGHQSDVRPHLQEAAVAVLSSDREGVPKALLEAASCGLPIVASDVPGCRDVVVDGHNGYLVPVKSPSRIAEALERLLSDPGLRRRFGMAGRRRVVEMFSERIVVDQTMALYNSMLGEDNARMMSSQSIEKAAA